LVGPYRAALHAGGLGRVAVPKHKSLTITETKTNIVKSHIARAQDAPHTNADGATAIERFATPH
jgi:hypothetical protein